MIVTAPQPSLAVATPVRLVLVSAGHSKTRLVGAVMLGGVESCTVIVWIALALLPQVSVASQVREMTLVPPQLLLTTSLKIRVTEPQPSTALAMPVTLVAVLAGHSKS